MLKYIWHVITQNGIKCPNCGSYDTMPWDEGYLICRDCGHEWKPK